MFELPDTDNDGTDHCKTCGVDLGNHCDECVRDMERELLSSELKRLRQERDDARNEIDSALFRGRAEAQAQIAAWLRSRRNEHGGSSSIAEQFAGCIEREEYD